MQGRRQSNYPHAHTPHDQLRASSPRNQPNMPYHFHVSIFCFLFSRERPRVLTMPRCAVHLATARGSVVAVLLLKGCAEAFLLRPPARPPRFPVVEHTAIVRRHSDQRLDVCRLPHMHARASASAMPDDGAEGEHRAAAEGTARTTAATRRAVAWACTLLPRFLRGVVLLATAALLFLLPHPAVSAAARECSSGQAERSVIAPASVPAGRASSEAWASKPFGSSFMFADSALRGTREVESASAEDCEAAAGTDSAECARWKAVALEVF